jgi:spore coat polysaccharide biosynthesis predicted glycosyltransferase SpsG
MKRLILTAVAVCGLAVSGLIVRAADEKKDDAKGEKVTGILIDNNCGAKQKDEQAAAKHPLSCAKKESCAASGYQVVEGSKHLKLDDKGNDLAKEYLAKATNTHVVVTGTVDGDTLKATSIAAAAGGSGGAADSKGGEKSGK